MRWPSNQKSLTYCSQASLVHFSASHISVVWYVSKMLVYAQSELQHLSPGDFITSVEEWQPLKPALEILATA